MTVRPLPTLVLSSSLWILACSSSIEGSQDEQTESGGAVGTGGDPLPSGGAATGGSPLGTGGSASGGVPTGGSPSGGTESGGALSSGGADADSGGSASGGDSATGGTATGGTGVVTGPSQGACTVGAGMQMGEGRSDERYASADVQRNGVNYRMIANGWGSGWRSHDISWLGSSMTIHDYDGSRQSNGAPAGYPTVFCGRYSDVSQDCGLPQALSGITEINTALKWSHPEGNGTYNVAYDVWLGDANAMGRLALQSYFMVWLRDPPGEQPAGSPHTQDVEIAGVEGKWNIIAGTVNSLPIVNYVRAEGDDSHELAFDIMDFVRDAQGRDLQMPGNDVLAVAIGFEIWEGPVTGLSLDDFCIDIQ